jgi:lipopolysaccharide export system protein LptC
MTQNAKKPSSKLSGLDFLQPKDTKRIRKARASRPFSSFVRRALPIVAGLVLLALIVWPIIDSKQILKDVMKEIPDIVVQNPHYSGLDNKNQPYALSAAMAKRPGGMQNIFDLEKPKGDITLENGSWLSGKADFGRFDQEARKLWLGGNVQLFHDKGYQFTSDEAQIDIDNSYAWGEKPVLLQGSFGQIRGQGFRLLDGGKTMIVKGPAKAILNLHADSGSDKPSEVVNP